MLSPRMTSSITLKRKGSAILRKLIVAAFWLGVWQLAFFLAKSGLLLPSPAQTFMRLFELAKTGDFWLKSLLSLVRIVEGFLLGVLAGVLLGILTARFRLLKDFFTPVINIVKATPVASFIILALVWLSKDGVPVFIAFLMVLPVIWANISEGIGQTDKDLLEMAKVFHFSGGKLFSKIYVPAVLPYLFAGCTTALGFAWKSGVAAEIIALPKQSIGYRLYESKLRIETVDLFAWTLLIVALSMLLEWLLVWSMRRIRRNG